MTGNCLHKYHDINWSTLCVPYLLFVCYISYLYIILLIYSWCFRCTEAFEGEHCENIKSSQLGVLVEKAGAVEDIKQAMEEDVKKAVEENVKQAMEEDVKKAVSQAESGSDLKMIPMYVLGACALLAALIALGVMAVMYKSRVSMIPL